MATMYGKPVVYRDGKPLAPATAAAVEAFDRAFYKRWGLHLVVNSGLRTPEYQDTLNAAWVAYKAGRGPKASYALRSTDPQAYHVITNPKGGKSVDLGDTGSDAGVATGHNARADWAREHAPRYGLSPRGYEFGEPWHFELIGDPWATLAGAGKPAGKPSSIKEISEEIGLDMSQIRYVHRAEKGYDTEWMICGQEIPGGYNVTTSVTVAVGWGAVYGTPDGDSWKALTRDQYIQLQLTMAKMNKDWVKQQKQIHGTK